MRAYDKPKLSVEEQLKNIEYKNIAFDLYSREDAGAYLSENNNYFKLMSYRKNFPKDTSILEKEAYVDLDFWHLKDLAIIDMHLRHTLLLMAVDLEHFAKVRLLHALEESDEDGYKVVEEFLTDFYKDERGNELRQNLVIAQRNPYTTDMAIKYRDRFPAWAFIEIISLKQFTDFYFFCAKKLERQDLEDDYQMLREMRQIRNASAHNACIINDLNPEEICGVDRHNLSRPIYKLGILRSFSDEKLSNVRIRQIVTLLYVHKMMVTTPGVHDAQCRALNRLVERMFRDIGNYKENELITSTFEFLKTLVDAWFPLSTEE
ncbi:MAG: Abi family protein [Coriobacteriia bacterium]|nr:Abi family protein [Coriobacteriia bacterium]